MKKLRIDISKLTAGDIILTRRKGFRSFFIKRYTNGEYSHAMLYVGGGFVFESDAKGVTKRFIGNDRFGVADYIVLRSKQGLPNNTQELISFHANRYIGTPYTLKDAMKTSRFHDKKNSAISDANRTFCSRFVSSILLSCGVKISDYGLLASPGDFINKYNNVVKEALVNCSKPDVDIISNSFFSPEMKLNRVAKLTKTLRVIYGTKKEIEIHQIPVETSKSNFKKVLAAYAFASYWLRSSRNHQYERKIMQMSSIGESQRRNIIDLTIADFGNQIKYVHLLRSNLNGCSGAIPNRISKHICRLLDEVCAESVLRIEDCLESALQSNFNDMFENDSEIPCVSRILIRAAYSPEIDDNESKAFQKILDTGGIYSILHSKHSEHKVIANARTLVLVKQCDSILPTKSSDIVVKICKRNFDQAAANYFSSLNNDFHFQSLLKYEHHASTDDFFSFLESNFFG